MTTATTQTAELIRDLVNRFIDHPADLSIDVKEHPGTAYWTMQCHAEDHSKMVGKLGAHFYALKLLIAELGRAQDAQFILKRYLEPEPAPRQERMPRKKTEQYDPSTAEVLLTRILGSLGIGEFAVEHQSVSTLPGEPLTYTFLVFTRSSEDYNTLTVPREDNAQPMTTVGAIGTLFRAYANRDGVKFTIEVKRA